MAQRRDADEGRAQRPQDGMDGIPQVIDERDLVGEEFHRVTDGCAR